MQTIPLQAVPSQTTSVVLGGKNCAIALYQKDQGLFFDLSADSQPIVAGVLALDANKLVCREYLGFPGNILFLDTQGNEDPYYTGLGTRFVLVYLTAEENAVL